MKKIVIILILLVTLDISAQNNIEVSENLHLDDKSLTELADFLGIKYKEVKFSGKDLIGKSLSIKRYIFYKKSIIASDVIYPDNNIMMEDYGKLKDSVFNFKVFTQLNEKKEFIRARVSFLNSTINQNIPIYSNSGIIFMDEEKELTTDLLVNEDNYYCIIEYNTDLPESIEIYYRIGNLKSELNNNRNNKKQLIIFQFSIN